MKVLVLASANQRAAVSLVRSLENLNVDYGVLTAGGPRSLLTSFVGYQGHARRRHCGYYSAENSELFIESLQSMAKKFQRVLLLPTGESLLRWALEQRATLEKLNIYLPTVDLNIYKRISDKESYAELAVRYGMAVPAMLSSIPERFIAPLVVKPKVGTASSENVLKAPLLIEGPSNFASFKARGLDLSQHFAQEYIEGPSFYYCGIYDRGKRLADFSQQTIMQEPDGGSVVVAIPAELPVELIDKIDILMSDLEWFGVMMMEFKKSGETYYAIECNPRFWGPLQLSLDNGVDFAGMLVRISTGSTVPVMAAVREESRCGYLWLGGFLNALFKKMRLRRRIQFYPPVKDTLKDYRYRDVWLRTDTFIYFFLEFATILILGAKRLASTVANLIRHSFARIKISSG